MGDQSCWQQSIGCRILSVCLFLFIYFMNSRILIPVHFCCAKRGSLKEKRNETLSDYAACLISSRVTLQRSSSCALTRWEISLSRAPLTTQLLYGMLLLEGQAVVIVNVFVIAMHMLIYACVSSFTLYSTFIPPIDFAYMWVTATFSVFSQACPHSDRSHRGNQQCSV